MYGEEEFPYEDFSMYTQDRNSDENLEAGDGGAVKYIAVIYMRKLKWIDPHDPLHDIVYVGQAVRSATKYKSAKNIAEKRWKEENCLARNKSYVAGLNAALEIYGESAFYDFIVDEKFGENRSYLRSWANSREIELISTNGGVLKSMTSRCQQTLNLTSGGQGISQFDHNDSIRTFLWERFVKEITEYSDCYNTTLVPSS